MTRRFVGLLDSEPTRKVTKQELDAITKLVEQGTNAERLGYTGPAISWYETDTEKWFDLIGSAWTERLLGAGQVTQLITQGTNAERLVYSGPAIQWYETDTGIWYDLISNTWTQR